MSKITVIYDSNCLMYVSVPGSTITYDSPINTRRLTRPFHYAL
jgi:transcription elongation factor